MKRFIDRSVEAYFLVLYFNLLYHYNNIINYVVESNAVLKVKFQKLHSTVVDNVNAATIVDFLFQHEVLSSRDVRSLQRQYDPQQRCRDLLLRLHESPRPDAFIQLYRAISNEPHLQWLIDSINEFSIQSAEQQRYLSEPAG